jgi:hypothetical protein
MKNLKQIFWGLFFLSLTFSCSEDSGTLPTETGTDQNFNVFNNIFLNFLESQPSKFVNGSSGLTFSDESTDCGLPFLNFMENYTLNGSTCYHYVDREDHFESFSVVNTTPLPENLTLYAIASFLYYGIPQTGKHDVGYYCDFDCYPTISVRIYIVDGDERIINIYIADLTSVDVLNDGHSVSVTFDADFLPYYDQGQERIRGSGNLVCCN